MLSLNKVYALFFDYLNSFVSEIFPTKHLCILEPAPYFHTFFAPMAENRVNAPSKGIIWDEFSEQHKPKVPIKDHIKCPISTFWCK